MSNGAIDRETAECLAVAGLPFLMLVMVLVNLYLNASRYKDTVKKYKGKDNKFRN